MNGDRAEAEADDGAGHVQAPDARAALAGEPHRVVPVLVEPATPVLQRQRVVLPQALHVAHLEARKLQLAHHAAGVLQLSVGEHERVDERCSVEARLRPARDAVHHRSATRTQRALQ